MGMSRMAFMRTVKRKTSVGARRRMALVMATLTIGLAGLFAPPQPAQAAEGVITITCQEGETSHYDAYQVFCAEVDSMGHALQIGWPNQTTQGIVLGELDACGYQAWLDAQHPGQDQHDLAQNAAEFLSQQVMGSPGSLPQGRFSPTTDDGNVSILVARALAASADLRPQSVTANTSFSAEQGLWLFVSATPDTTATAASSAGTSPLWVVVGSEPLTVSEKSHTPTVVKQVRTKEGAWTSVTGAGMGEARSFRLVATLPDNFADYDHFHLTFEDQLSEGLALDKASSFPSTINVLVGDKKVAIDGTNLKGRYEKNKFSVTFDDLKAAWWDDAGITADTLISIEYPVRFTQSASFTAQGNRNSARIVYTNDPVRLTTSASPTVTATLLSCRLRLAKHHGDTPLRGARFTIRVKGAGKSDRYLQKDGSLGSKPHEFATNKKGTITVRGIDDGTYLISEVTAPSGYQQLKEDISLTIASHLDEANQSRQELIATCSSEAAQVTNVDAGTGTIKLSVSNKPHEMGVVKGEGPSPGRLAQTGVGVAAIVTLLLGLALILGTRHERTSG